MNTRSRWLRRRRSSCVQTREVSNDNDLYTDIPVVARNDPDNFQASYRALPPRRTRRPAHRRHPAIPGPAGADRRPVRRPAANGRIAEARLGPGEPADHPPQERHPADAARCRARRVRPDRPHQLPAALLRRPRAPRPDPRPAQQRRDLARPAAAPRDRLPRANPPPTKTTTAGTRSASKSSSTPSKSGTPGT